MPPPSNLLEQERSILATLMDQHPEHFGHPQTGTSWSELMEAPGHIDPADRRALDRALGTVLNVLRNASLTHGGGASLDHYLSQGGIGEALEPDRLTLQVFEGAHESDAVALARGVTAYRQLRDEGLLTDDAMQATVVTMLDDLPAETPLARSAIEAAKGFALAQAQYLFEAPSGDLPASPSTQAHS